MFSKLKKGLDKELVNFLAHIETRYGTKKISPLIHESMKNFILRDGKRVRPILFVIAYQGFSRKKPKNLFRSALAIELLHDFLLIHDDIVDKSDTRRGKPSMHALLEEKTKHLRKRTFRGSDLAIVLGDIMYAISIESFLSIEENPKNKEKALIKFVESACYTGCGEFIELLYSAEDVSKITRSHIYKIYDYKTAYYTFVAPLVTGAILAGAAEKDLEKLNRFGICLGRAFQINDDILGIFGDEKKTGKPSSSDLQENKKTLLLWHAFKKSSSAEKKELQRILAKKKINKTDLRRAQQIIVKNKSLEHARNQIKKLSAEAIDIIESSAMRSLFKNELIKYAGEILST